MLVETHNHWKRLGNASNALQCALHTQLRYKEPIAQSLAVIRFATTEVDVSSTLLR